MNDNTKIKKDKEFKKNQLFFLLVSASIILLSLILKPGDHSQDDRLSIFGFKTPILCFHMLIYNKPCAGCDLTRSFVCFAHGDIEASFEYHKLGIPLFLLVLYQIPIRFYLLKTGISGYSNFMKKMIEVPFIIAGIALVINWLFFLYQTSFIAN